MEDHRKMVFFYAWIFQLPPGIKTAKATEHVQNV